MYRELDQWKARLKDAELQAQSPDEHDRALTYIIEELFKELELHIFQRDRDGNLKTDKDGRPKIAWISVITGAFKLVAKILFLRDIWRGVERNVTLKIRRTGSN